MASLDTLIVRDMAAIVASADSPLSREVVFWDRDVTDLVLDPEDGIATVNANVFFKIENRMTDGRGKTQVKVATLSFSVDTEGAAVAVDEQGWFQIDADTAHTYRIESANETAGNWTVRGRQQRRVNRSAGNRTHGV